MWEIFSAPFKNPFNLIKLFPQKTNNCTHTHSKYAKNAPVRVSLKLKRNENKTYQEIRKKKNKKSQKE